MAVPFLVDRDIEFDVGDRPEAEDRRLDPKELFIEQGRIKDLHAPSHAYKSKKFFGQNDEFCIKFYVRSIFLSHIS